MATSPNDDVTSGDTLRHLAKRITITPEDFLLTCFKEVRAAGVNVKGSVAPSGVWLHRFEAWHELFKNSV